MESVFFLDGEARARFLRTVAQAFGCTYICLWSYIPHPSNCFFSMDGWYSDENDQPSSSSGSLARRLFDDYRRSLYSIENNRIPGLAFCKGLPYVELNELELLQQAWTDTQRRFYQVLVDDSNKETVCFFIQVGLCDGDMLIFAQCVCRRKLGSRFGDIQASSLFLEFEISNNMKYLYFFVFEWQTAAFMGCRRGEIELGMSIPSQNNMEMELRIWFPENFSQQSPFGELPRPSDQNWPSSSSSSLRSLSMDSSEQSSLLFNTPSTSYMIEFPKEAPIEQTSKPAPTAIMPPQQAMQVYDQLRHIQFPTAESDDAAMARAMIAIISCSSSPSSSYPPQQNQPYNYQVRQQKSAFNTYTSVLALAPTAQTSLRRRNMLNRAITFFRSINSIRNQEQVQGSRPTSTQLHHMISERKRREKINESFQALKSLLPPGTKKDKASVLSSTRDYLSSLKAQVFELRQKNRQLQARLSTAKEASEEASGSSSRRIDVQVTTSESTSEDRNINLQVTVRGDCIMLNLVLRILEFLKQTKDIKLVSMEADTQLQQSNSINRVILRLNIKGSEWDESGFREAIARIVSDVAQ
ncbi:hypothetical protein HHK36_005999 [Tetracentron sinense]|uniref:BHLH domain-containing protein n=1 Tax=Tetracentron sinense TaxID=13715 RepID=A0A835DJT5_TETSI|nr:hypothetical protein HHK36_005999 [Tetracentron sinense]